MAFTTTPLLSGGVLVEGTDSKGVDGTAVLHSVPWQNYQARLAHKDATAEFDQVVMDFFKPFTEAADKIKARLEDPAKKWSTIVLTESVDGERGEILELDTDGTLLRILAETDGSSLRWVNGGLVAVL